MSPPDPRDIKRIPKLPPIETDALKFRSRNDAAVKEAHQLSRGKSAEEIAAEAAEGEHNRTEKFKNHFEIIGIFAMYFISFLFLIVSLTWFYHLLAPIRFQYFTEDQFSKLQSVVTGGVVGVILAHLKRRVG